MRRFNEFLFNFIFQKIREEEEEAILTYFGKILYNFQ